MKSVLTSFMIAIAFTAWAVPAQAQAPTTAWSLDAGIGWDPGISGDVFSAGIGIINGRPAVIENQSWSDAYGTGFHFRIGAGYDLSDRSELRFNFRYQSVGADLLTVGNVAGNPLVATLDDYTTWGFEGGYRAYFSEPAEKWRPYAEGTIGFAVIKEIDANFAVPALGIVLNATDFYDQTGSLTLSVGGGVLYNVTERFALDGRLGLRYVGGLSEIDGLAGTGLENTNDDSARWVMPLTVGVRFRF